VKPGLSRHDIIAAYRDSHRMHGESPAAVQWPKGRQDLRFRALTRQIDPAEPCSLLDFGCGLAHLKDYLDQHGFRVDYTGADIVPEFVDAVAARHPGARVMLLDDPAALTERYDHVVASGTFNIVGDGVLPLSTVIRLTGRGSVPVPHPLAMPVASLLWSAQISEAPPTFLDYLRWICVADGDKARRAERARERPVDTDIELDRDGPVLGRKIAV
jgi:hypothetical protein